MAKDRSGTPLEATRPVPSIATNTGVEGNPTGLEVLPTQTFPAGHLTFPAPLPTFRHGLGFLPEFHRIDGPGTDTLHGTTPPRPSDDGLPLGHTR